MALASQRKDISWSSKAASGEDSPNFTGGKYIDDKGYVYFHNIVKTKDNNYYAIGEYYKRNANAAGIALNILAIAGGGGGGNANTKLVITNSVFFKFNSEGKKLQTPASSGPLDAMAIAMEVAVGSNSSRTLDWVVIKPANPHILLIYSKFILGFISVII